MFPPRGCLKGISVSFNGTIQSTIKLIDLEAVSGTAYVFASESEAKVSLRRTLVSTARKSLAGGHPRLEICHND